MNEPDPTDPLAREVDHQLEKTVLQIAKLLGPTAQPCVCVLVSYQTPDNLTRTQSFALGNWYAITQMAERFAARRLAQDLREVAEDWSTDG